ncbi:MAG: hypothetical protein JWR15_3661 [Prosthecobacter sp.]|nr:hypothetical protein [Prosthecobacter sp.]
MKHCLCLFVLLLVACGKEAPQPKAAAAPKHPIPEKKLPPTPQGKLPQMDPEKAKFIAVPSTPKDPQVKKVEKPLAKPATETKKAAAAKPADEPVIEVKKAAPAAVQK